MFACITRCVSIFHCISIKRLLCGLPLHGCSLGCNRVIMTVSLIDADTKDKIRVRLTITDSEQNRTDSSALDNHQWIFSELQTQRKQLAYSMLLKQKNIVYDGQSKKDIIKFDL